MSTHEKRIINGICLGEKTASLVVKEIKIKTNFYFHISNYYRIFKCIIVLIPHMAKDTGFAEEVRGRFSIRTST